MKLFKITDSNHKTRNNVKWGEGVTNSILGGLRTPKLCTYGVLHAYSSALLAAFLHPAHVDYTGRVLWEAEGEVVVGDAFKVGCYSLTTQKIIPMPEVTNEQRVRFAVLCAQKVSNNSHFKQWAADWLSGKDRTMRSAIGALSNLHEWREDHERFAVKAAYIFAGGVEAFSLTQYAAASVIEYERHKPADVEALAQKALYDPITLQRAFNAAWKAFIVEEREPAAADEPVQLCRGSTPFCSYLTRDGRKCAIGLLIPDGHIAQKFVGPVGALMESFPELFDADSRDGLENMQRDLHDFLTAYDKEGRAQWKYSWTSRKETYETFAREWNLTIPDEVPPS